MPVHTHSTHNNPVDVLLKILADPCRRTIVSYLQTKDTDSATLDELVDHVHKEVDEVTIAQRARISLIHIHLPKLADYGVIEYDQRSETVRYRDEPRLEALLEIAAIDDSLD